MVRIAVLVSDQSLWLFRLKKGFIVRYRNVLKKPIKTFWWRDVEHGIVNFGDEITKDIVNRIFGYRCVWAPLEECSLIGVGSIVELAMPRQANNTIHVWGSGFIREQSGDDNLHDLVFHAVRGERTLDRVGGSENIVLGDPGLLANITYRPAKQKNEKIGVVVHYIDSDLPIVDKIKNDERFMIINPLDAPDNVAWKISSCRFILSSSLHGLIFADSFGVPNIHVKFSDKVTGGEYKFRDYYSATGREYRAADNCRIFDQEYLKSLRNEYLPIKDLHTLQRKLIKAFPFK